MPRRISHERIQVDLQQLSSALNNYENGRLPCVQESERSSMIIALKRRIADLNAKLVREEDRWSSEAE
jgi:hypothetical protein